MEQLFAISTIVLILISGVYYAQEARLIQDESRRVAAMVNANVDSLITSIDSLSYTIGISSAIDTWADDLGNSRPELSAYFEVENELVYYKALNRKLSSLAVFIYDSGYVVTENGALATGEYKNNFSIPDTITFTQYARSIDKGQFVKYTNGNQSRYDRTVYALPIINSSGESFGVLFATLKDSEIYKDIDAISAQNFDYVVYDDYGIIGLSQEAA